jgi:hypothetical protein
VCPRGHEIRSAADRNTQGRCRECQREDDRLRRVRDRAALDVVAVFHSAGVEFLTDDGTPRDPNEIVRELIASYPITD